MEYLSRAGAEDPGEVHGRGRGVPMKATFMCAARSPGTKLPRERGKNKGVPEALSLNLTQIKALAGIDVVHTHTWYVSMAGFLAKKLYDIPFVLTTHSLEPLRAWKAESWAPVTR